jgi:hypothetical protein
VLIFFFINLKTIKLFFIRFFYGNYSYKYVTYHKNKFIKNPHPPCIKDDLMNHCFNFVDLNPQKKLYFTKSTIIFGFHPFYTDFKTIKGNTTPDCFNIYKFDEYTIKIVGFKKEIFGNEIKEVYFFIDDIFFMGEYTFSDVSKVNTEKLIGMLTTKYKINEQIVNETFYIQDNQESLLYFENNGFTISIQYINFKEPLVNKVWNSYFKNLIKKDTFFTDEGDREIFAKL